MYKRLSIKLISISLILFLAFSGIPLALDFGPEPATVSAATIIVDQGGGGNYTTIQAAVNAANFGDTIYVWAGTYTENVVISKTLTIIGNSTTNTTIDGSGTGDVMYISADYVNISKLKILNSGSISNDAGIEVYQATNCKIENNNCSDNYYGILIKESDNNIVSNNTCLNNTDGIYLRDSNSNTVDNNTANMNFQWGIIPRASHSNTLNNNTIGSNGYGAIYLLYTNNNILSNNTMLNDGIFIGGLLSQWNSHTIDISNTVNGGPLYYRKNQNGGSIPLDAGEVILVSCQNVHVEDLNVSNSNGISLGYSNGNYIRNNIFDKNWWAGLWLDNCDYNIIDNNSCSYNDENGIDMIDSDYNIIINNTCNYNKDGVNNLNGIHMSYSQSNTVSYNTCNGNRFGINIDENAFSNIIKNNICNQNIQNGLMIHGSGNRAENNTCNFNTENGILIPISDSNEIINNSCTGNKRGIYLRDTSDFNLVVGNMITNNDLGINISSSSNNVFYYNNIHNNIIQALSDSANQWDNGDSEGNFWSDYSGVDDGSNDRVVGDGIGDTSIPHQGLDWYPFITTSGWHYPGIPNINDPGGVNSIGNYPVNWNNTRNAIGYVLQECLNITFDTPTEIYNGTNLSVDITGRVNGTYYYKVKAYNDRFVSDWSSVVDIIVDWPPETPLNLTVSVYPEGNGLNLSWNLNTADTIEYYIYYKTTGAWNLVASVPHPKYTYDHAGLLDGETYYYHVQAADSRSQLSGFSDIMEGVPADTVAPSPPTGLETKVLLFESILLNWEDNPENDVQGYNVYRSTTSTTTDWGEPINSATLMQQSHYTDQDLDEITTYYYVITAVDEVPHESDYSEVINATTYLGEHSPELNNSLVDLEIPEDTYDDTSINLYHWFMDVNGDPLQFRCEGQENIVVNIYPTNGTVTLNPNLNWNGKETLTFFASDGKSEVSDDVKITVTPVNDPPKTPVIVEPKDNTKIDDGVKLDFKATCDDPDLDDGDELEFAWCSNISGAIGTGETLEDIILSIGIHKITLTVSDHENASSKAAIIIIVRETALSDSDGDKMPNVWERDNGFDPYNPSDAEQDFDNDDLTNLKEFIKCTDPRNQDTDNDGLADGAEVNLHNTNATNPDTDGDGYYDGEDVFPLDDSKWKDVKDSSKKGDDDSIWYILLAVIIIVIVIIVVILVLVKKSKDEPEPEPSEPEPEPAFKPPEGAPPQPPQYQTPYLAPPQEPAVGAPGPQPVVTPTVMPKVISKIAQPQVVEETPSEEELEE